MTGPDVNFEERSDNIKYTAKPIFYIAPTQPDKSMYKNITIMMLCEIQDFEESTHTTSTKQDKNMSASAINGRKNNISENAPILSQATL